MFALLAYVFAVLFVLTVQARDIRTTKAEAQDALIAKAEALGFNAYVLGAELSIALAEALMEEYGTSY